MLSDGEIVSKDAQASAGWIMITFCLGTILACIGIAVTIL